MYFIYFILFCLIRTLYADIYDLEDADYERMPPPFQLDDYEKCLGKPYGLYCTLRMEVVSNGSSELHAMMQEYSRYVGHFNYSTPVYGVCASGRCTNMNNSSNQHGSLQSCMNQMFYEKYQLMVTIVDFTCSTSNTDIEINPADIFVAVLISSILLLNIFGSLYDFHFTHNEKNIVARLLLCFSVRRNWRKLRAPGAAGPEERLKALKGFNALKVITTLFVIIGHSLFPYFMFMDNPRYEEYLYKSILFKMVCGSVLIVQIFFILSGFLLSYNLQLLQEKRALGWTMAPMAIIMRWLRLTPPFAVWIAITCTWFKFVGFGALRPLAVIVEHDDCNKYWWRHLLYINNLYSDNQNCFPHSWYIAADTQMYIGGVIVCIFFKSMRAKSVVLATLSLVAFVIPPLTIYYKDLDSLLMVSPKIMNLFITSDITFLNIHAATVNNAFNYILGLALGLIVYKLQQNNFDLRKYKKYCFVIWMLVPINFAVLGTASIFYMEQPRLPLYIRILHGALVRPLYGIIFAIGLLLYIFNIDAISRAILELPVWTMPSRLSYSAYILHFTIIRIVVLNMQVLEHASVMYMLQITLWCIVCSYIAAVPIWFLVEAPFVQLSKCLIPTKETNTKETDLNSDADYERMPPPYQLDDYEKCMRKSDGLYCTLNMEVISNSSSELYNMMQEYSKYIGHYNYSNTIYGICASERCGNLNNISNRHDALQSCMNRKFYEKYQLMVSVVAFTCFTPNTDIEINTADVFVAVLLSGILLMNICGSLYDFYSDSEEKKTGARLLLCFSVRKNWRKLSAPGADGPEERLKHLKGFNGAKFISTLIVIVGHTLLLFSVCIDNPRFVENTYKSNAMKIACGSILTIQIFFILSSFLLSYNLQLIQEKRRLKWTMVPSAIIIRWLSYILYNKATNTPKVGNRLTPPYGIALAILCTWFRFVGLGPLKQMMITREYDECNKYWWRHILYINNLYENQDCFRQTWYLAADTQMYVVGVIICIFFKSGRAKSAALAMLSLMAFIIPPLIIYYKDLDSILLISPKLMNRFITSDTSYFNIHTTTATNAFNYLLGLALGLLTYKLQQKNFDLRKYKKYRFVLWLLIPVGAAIVGSASLFYMEQPRQSVYIRMLHGALARPLYGITVAIGILLFIFNLDATFKLILEWQVWTIPSRLSYSAFILHIMFVKISAANIQVLGYASLLFMMQNMLWCVVCSYVAAVPLWFLVEAPFVQLSKCLIPTKETNSKEIEFESGMHLKVENNEQRSRL